VPARRGASKLAQSLVCRRVRASLFCSPSVSKRAAFAPLFVRDVGQTKLMEKSIQSYAADELKKKRRPDVDRRVFE